MKWSLHTAAAAICGSALTFGAWANPRDLQWRYSGTTNNLRAVVAGAGQQFVAVGDAGTIVTSTDTVQWSLRASGSVADLYYTAWPSVTECSWLWAAPPMPKS